MGWIIDKAQGSVAHHTYIQDKYLTLYRSLTDVMVRVVQKYLLVAKNLELRCSEVHLTRTLELRCSEVHLMHEVQ